MALEFWIEDDHTHGHRVVCRSEFETRFVWPMAHTSPIGHGASAILAQHHLQQMYAFAQFILDGGAYGGNDDPPRGGFAPDPIPEGPDGQALQEEDLDLATELLGPVRRDPAAAQGDHHADPLRPPRRDPS